MQLTQKHRYIVKITYDAFIFVIAYIVYFSFLGINTLGQLSAPLLSVLGLHLLASLFCFYKIGLYRHVIRYFDVLFVHKILFPVICSSIALNILLVFFLGIDNAFFYSLVYVCTLLVGMAGARLVLYHMLVNAVTTGNSETKSVLIYGAGSAGVQLAHMLKYNQHYCVKGFVDDNLEKQGSVIFKYRVFPKEKIKQLSAHHDVQTVILAIPSATREQRTAIIDELLACKLEVKTIPSLESLLDESQPVSYIKELDIQDILGREEVSPNPDLLAQDIYQKTVLVSGAGGSIGSELCRQIIQQHPTRLLLLDVSEYNLYMIDKELNAHRVDKNTDNTIEIISLLGTIQSTERLREIFEHYPIDTVYHAAAYKHVPLVEHNIIEGVKNNIFGSHNLIQFAIKNHVKRFVLISTDKAVRPTNTMGATKRFAELIMQAYASLDHHTTISMVRFGNVLGSSGSVVPLFKHQIKQGGPITVTHKEITRYFMSIPEASQLVIQAGAMGKGGDVFVLDMGKPKKILDLAKNMITLSGLTHKDDNNPQGDIEICVTGLRPGEKLYEELLIGDDVNPTSHPKIMTADELSLAPAELDVFLNRLRFACVNSNYTEIRRVLLEAPLSFSPTDDNVDHILVCKEKHHSSFHSPTPKSEIKTG